MIATMSIPEIDQDVVTADYIEINLAREGEIHFIVK